MSENLRSWRQWIEPWYFSYALLGASVAGLAPIMLPLAVGRRGSVADIGLVVGAFNLGGLTAPAWGGLADRYGLHRWLLLAGLSLTALALAAFPFIPSLNFELVLALAQGAGAVSAATVANLYIVETHPQSEWNERIGWLQTFYGGGQVAGLVVAAFSGSPRTGILVAAGLLAVAFLPALSMRGELRTSPFQRPLVRIPSRHAGVSAGSPQFAYHQASVVALKHYLHSVFSPLGIFLIAWFISFGGASAFFSLYPVVMEQTYGVSPSISSIGFAAAAAVGLFLYAPAGVWSRTYGAVRVLRSALGVRTLAFLVLLVAGMLFSSVRASLGQFSFLFVVLAWSLLSVSGTEITANLSTAHEGEGMGLFNATTALAGVFGAVVGGWGAGKYGYALVPGLGLAGAVIGIMLTGIMKQPLRKNKGT